MAFVIVSIGLCAIFLVGVWLMRTWVTGRKREIGIALIVYSVFEMVIVLASAGLVWSITLVGNPNLLNKAFGFAIVIVILSTLSIICKNTIIALRDPSKNTLGDVFRIF